MHEDEVVYYYDSHSTEEDLIDICSSGLYTCFRRKTWGWTNLESASWTVQVERKDKAHGPAH